MALASNAVLGVGTGHFYTAPVGTDVPADLTVLTDWVEIGHTSIDNILTFGSDGGDETTLGSLQNPSLRISRTPRVDYFSINLLQFDVDSLKLFYGSNAVVGANGWLQPNASNAASTTAAFLMLLEDGENSFGLHCPQADIFADDVLSINDTTSLASLPIRVTPQVYQNNLFAYELLPLNATAGS